jgi:2-polyprenyl-3-methyl-5-hydroxy-6-metoxy-1,4-benzoquinol methylase
MSNLVCVECGKSADKGSMQHPYCEQCFSKEWKSQDHYESWLENHNNKPYRSFKSQNKEFEIDLFDSVVDGIDSECSEDLYDQVQHYLSMYGFCLKNKLVLEAGCGTGKFSNSLLKDSRFNSNANTRIIGIDISQGMVDAFNSNSNSRARAYKGDLEDNLIFSKDTFDCVICPCVLHHFPDPSMAMINLCNMLKPSGMIIIIEPNGSNPVLRFSRLLRLLIPNWIIMKYKLASPNETEHSINKYIDLLVFNRLFCLSVDTLSSSKPMTNNGFIVSILIRARRMMLNILRFMLPYSKYSGDACLIVAVKEVTNE